MGFNVLAMFPSALTWTTLTLMLLLEGLETAYPGCGDSPGLGKSTPAQLKQEQEKTKADFDSVAREMMVHAKL
jgi:hypothetical protein